MDLVLCHYPTACGTMRDFPNRRPSVASGDVPRPGFRARGGPDCSLTGRRRTVGCIIYPVACDVVPERHIHPIEVDDLKAFRFIPIF